MDGILTQEQEDYGLSCKLLFDQIVLLDPKDYPIESFSCTAEHDVIRKRAEEYLRGDNQ